MVVVVVVTVVVVVVAVAASARLDEDEMASALFKDVDFAKVPTIRIRMEI